MSKHIQVMLMIAVIGLLVIVFGANSRVAGLSSTKYLYDKPMFLNIK